MRATIEDVAARAGVSIATVSHVLNRTRFVSPELTERVLAAVRDLDYEPDPVARGLRNRSTNLVALVIPDITNPYFPAFARGAQDVVAEHGYAAIVCNTDRNPDREREFLHMLRRQRVEGIILNPAGAAADEILPIQASGIAIVLLGEQINHPKFDAVMIDNVQAAFDMVSYLIKRGHRRIAHLAGWQTIISGRQRLQGYRRALEMHGLAVDNTLVIEGPWTKSGGSEAMRRLLAVRPLPTAVFAANDLMAIGAMIAVQQAGLKIPDDVAVAGFDDIEEAGCVAPALTTVNQPKYEIGRRAAQILLRRLHKEGPRKRQRVVLPHQLVIRASA